MTENWDDLRIFLAVARGESLSAAARLLRMDPATVGRRVARLEQGLGHPLFGKSPQGYALSEAGAKGSAARALVGGVCGARLGVPLRDLTYFVYFEHCYYHCHYDHHYY